MKQRKVDGGATRTMVVVFDKGEEFIEGMQELAETAQFASAHFEAIGAFSDVLLAFFDRHTMEYKDIPVAEQVEVLSLEGNIVREDDGYKVHATPSSAAPTAAPAAATSSRGMSGRPWRSSSRNRRCS